MINEIKKSAGISEKYTYTIYDNGSSYHGLQFQSKKYQFLKGEECILTFNFINGKVNCKIDGLLLPDRVLLNALKKKYGY